MKASSVNTAMLRAAKRAFAQLLVHTGISALVESSRWRRHRLLILCYHGVSIEREHEWRPSLFIKPELLERRCELLRRRGYSVLALDEAVRRLYAGELPERSLVLTFDDGTHDFHSRAFPVLREYGFPATVYLTTYYSDHRYPVFHLICSYMMWKRSGRVVAADRLLGRGVELDLRTDAGQRRALDTITGFAKQEGLSAADKDALARNLGHLLGEDVDELWGKRVLQIMSPDEVAQVSREGIDIQLHTHRHRSPVERGQYLRELSENRTSILASTGGEPVHFCYPSGEYRAEFLPWLRQAGVVSATTCEPGIASIKSAPLLLPRYIDTGEVSDAMFQAWLSGAGSFLPNRRARRRLAHATPKAPGYITQFQPA